MTLFRLFFTHTKAHTHESSHAHPRTQGLATDLRKKGKKTSSTRFLDIVITSSTKPSPYARSFTPTTSGFEKTTTDLLKSHSPQTSRANPVFINE